MESTGNRRSSFGSLFTGKRRQQKDAAGSAESTPKTLNVPHWLELCSVGNYKELWRALADHLSATVPVVYAVNAAQPWDVNLNQAELIGQLLRPLSALLSGDEHATDLLGLAEQYGLSANARRPGQICGRMFKSGEAVYSCKECANDATCVMCQECFANSGHKNHRYNVSVNMHTSGGSGYCDCGDEEAWSSDVHCELHKPVASEQHCMHVDEPECQLDEALQRRLYHVMHMLVSYCVRLYCGEAVEGLPPALGLSSGRPLVQPDEYPCVTVLFNDETHTYDGVIRALEHAILCSEQQAMLLATIVDREGRSCVRAGSKDWCEKAKAEIQRKTAKDRNKRTGKSGPLVVEVLDTLLFAHQNFAIQLMTQFCQWIQTFPPLQKIVSDIVLDEHHFDTGTRDDYDGCLVRQMLLRDRKLWKGARTSVHSLFMCTVLMHTATKLQFSVLFTELYPELMDDFVDDDHEHSSSVVALTVQMYTVPTLARRLIAEHGALSLLLNCFLDRTQQFVKPDTGRYDFSQFTYPPYLRRALFVAGDLKYLLNTVPSADDWTDELQTQYLAGLSCLLAFLRRMQNMDMVQRQTGVHQTFESEWETAFNMQLRFEEVISMFICWVSTNAEVAVKAVDLAVAAVANELNKQENGVNVDHIELEMPGAGSGVHSSVIQYDVSEQPVTVHIPLCRMLAALYARCVAHHSVPPINLCEKLLEQMEAQCSAVVMELPLRVAVLTAQAQAGMWRRNGYALLNQIHNYYSPLCRSEMYDRDVLMLQIAASVMKPSDFVVRCLHKFGLVRWAQWSYEETLPPDEPSKFVVVQAEELLQWIIVLIGERYHYGVSSASIQDYVRREVVHLLCKGPTPYSKIQKRLCFDPMLEKLAIEDTVKQVATFKKPSGTAAGQFELKEEYREQYNPFFFHFSKSDVSAAEQQQQKGRQHWLPPDAPPFTQPFANIKRLLLGHNCCDVMFQVLSITLERSIRRSRFSSDGLLHRALYLIGMALNEQFADVANFKFTQAADDWAERCEVAKLSAHMNKLCGSQEAVCVSDLLKALLKRWSAAAAFLRAHETGDSAMDTDAHDHAVSQEHTRNEEEDKKRLKRIAIEKRQKAMQQMQRLQKNFAEQNQTLLDQEQLDDDPTDETKLVKRDEFPVSLGRHRQPIEPGRARSVTCILCQESELMQPSARPCVYATFVQPSTLFAAYNQPKPVDSDTAKAQESKPDWLHLLTDHQYHASQRSPGRRQNLFVSSRLVKVDEGEYQCPLCKRLSNAALPVLPATHNWLLHCPKRSAEPVQPFAKWLRYAHQQAFKTAVNSPQLKLGRKMRNRNRSGPSLEQGLATGAGAHRTSKEAAVHRRSAAAAAALRKRTYSATAQSPNTSGGSSSNPVSSSFDESSSSQQLASSAPANAPDVPAAEAPAGRDEAPAAGPVDLDAFAQVLQHNLDDEETNALVQNLLRHAAHFEQDDDDDDSTQYSTADEGSAGEQPNQSDDGSDDEQAAGVDAPVAQLQPQHNAAAQVAVILANRPDGGGSALSHARDMMRSIVPSLHKLFPHPTGVNSARSRARDERMPPPALFGAADAKGDYWLAIGNYAKAVINHGLGVPQAPYVQCLVGVWQSAAHTIRCTAVVSKIEGKPLFGAHNVRQSDCLYAVCRVSVTAACLLRTSRSRWLQSRLLSVLLRPTDQCPSVLDLDLWTWLVQAVLCSGVHGWQPVQPINMAGPNQAHLLRLALTALVFQVIIAHEPAQHKRRSVAAGCVVSQRRAELLRAADACLCAECEQSLRTACVSAAADMLRAAALFWHALTHVPPPESLKDPSIDELTSMCRYLALPDSADGLLDMLFAHDSLDLMRRWSEHRRVRQLYTSAAAAASSSALSLPIRSQPLRPNLLIQLPHSFGELINKAVTFSCPMLNSDDTTRAPTLCLLCGAMVCSQSYCCQRTITVSKQGAGGSETQQQIGACNWHMRHCAAPAAALFLRIRDSQILLLTSHYRGCFLPAPYVDEYGETDQGFRRGNPLYLNAQLYAKLESLWLQHGVAERVIGQYEINPQNAQIEWQHL